MMVSVEVAKTVMVGAQTGHPTSERRYTYARLLASQSGGTPLRAATNAKKNRGAIMVSLIRAGVADPEYLMRFISVATQPVVVVSREPLACPMLFELRSRLGVSALDRTPNEMAILFS